MEQLEVLLFLRCPQKDHVIDTTFLKLRLDLGSKLLSIHHLFIHLRYLSVEEGFP